MNIFFAIQNLLSAGEYLNVEILNLEEEARALDRVAQKLEKELRNAMQEGVLLNLTSAFCRTV